jgi:hypothetical protein
VPDSPTSVVQKESKNHENQHEHHVEDRQHQATTWYLSGSNRSPEDKSWDKKNWRFVEKSKSLLPGDELGLSLMHCMGTYSPWVDPKFCRSRGGGPSLSEGGVDLKRRHSLLRAVPDTNEKRAWFREICRRRQQFLLKDKHMFNNRAFRIIMEISVAGDRVLGNAFDAITKRTTARDGTFMPVEMWRPFRVVMETEGVRTGGTDMGGVQREWFDLVGRELFSCKHGLFKQATVGGKQRLYVNEDSKVCNETHLDYFRFAGRLIAMSIVHSVNMRAPLCDYIWKLMASESVCVDDVASLDHDLHAYLCQLGAVEDVEACDLEFKYVSQSLGREMEFSLGGDEDEVVTNENRDVFIQKWTRMALIGRCEEQLLSMMRGLYEVIPQDVLSVMSSVQIRDMVNGQPGKINVTEWRRCTRYIRSDSSVDMDKVDAVVWFWDVVIGMEEKDKSKLLQFCTGSSTVPAGGFDHFVNRAGRSLPFTIQLSEISSSLASENRFPSSHTCFNELILPKYNSRNAMERGLDMCLQNCTGFGFE